MGSLLLAVGGVYRMQADALLNRLVVIERGVDGMAKVTVAIGAEGNLQADLLAVRMAMLHCALLASFDIMVSAVGVMMVIAVMTVGSLSISMAIVHVIVLEIGPYAIANRLEPKGMLALVIVTVMLAGMLGLVSVVAIFARLAAIRMVIDIFVI